VLAILIVSMVMTVQQVDEVVITRSVQWEHLEPRAAGRRIRHGFDVRKDAVKLTLPSNGRSASTPVLELFSRAEPGEASFPNYIHLYMRRVADGLSLRVLNVVASRPGHDHRALYGELLWRVGSGP